MGDIFHLGKMRKYQQCAWARSIWKYLWLKEGFRKPQVSQLLQAESMTDTFQCSCMFQPNADMTLILLGIRRLLLLLLWTSAPQQPKWQVQLLLQQHLISLIPNQQSLPMTFFFFKFSLLIKIQPPFSYWLSFICSITFLSNHFLSPASVPFVWCSFTPFPSLLLFKQLKWTSQGTENFLV